MPHLQETSSFFKHTWEQGPAVYRATEARRRLLGGRFSFQELLRLAHISEQEGGPLEFGTDVNAARYVNGVRETPNGEVGAAPGAATHNSPHYARGARCRQPIGAAGSGAHRPGAQVANRLGGPCRSAGGG
jgi:hypothetical protein